jgi:membrane protease subunit HflK
MAREGKNVPSDERVRRSVQRTVANVVALVLSVGILAAWSYFGIYQLEPGQAAVILRFGKYSRTVAQPGLRWHLPPPLETHEIVNVGAVEREEFGAVVSEKKPEDHDAMLDASMQTSDNNIVVLGFVTTYRVGDAFEARYRVADPRATLRDAAQAAVREVVGRMTIDGVLSEGRGAVQLEAQQILQATLDRYQTGLKVLSIELQEVQPPHEVRKAFDDVIAASQDRNRLVNEAQGYANEVVPQARAKAAEQTEQARGFKESRVAEATGAAERFRALANEYEKAPDVTRKRLYLETMEVVLPQVETLVIEPGTAQILPWLPGSAGRSAPPPAASAPPPVSAPKTEAKP